MKKLLLLLLLPVVCTAQNQSKMMADNYAAIEKVLTNWHKAAAEAKFDTYFSMTTSDFVFIGTDPTEHWDADAFKAYSRPYFDKGKAWSFVAIDRHIYLTDGDFAYFDELLDTQMKLCRGSGVMRKVDGQWKIAHYVLSMTVPNDNTDEVIKLKTAFDDEIKKMVTSGK